MSENYITKSAPSRTYRIWIAGDFDTARKIAREYCLTGFCVSLQRTEYIYTFGEETGICVTILNYPRFPLPQTELQAHAIELGYQLADGLCQGSFSVEGPEETIFVSRRDEK